MINRNIIQNLLLHDNMKLYIFILLFLLSCNTGKKQSDNIDNQKCNTNKLADQKIDTSKVGIQKIDNKNQTGKTSKNISVDYSVGAPTIIYKTKKDYADKIPVSMNDEKTKIVSYPAVKDIYYNGKLAYPTQLNDGYLLDNRGIGKNTVFLSITYDAYSKLTEVPSLADMMKMIINKEPFTEIYNCGNRHQFKDILTDLNKIITDKQLTKFKKIL